MAFSINKELWQFIKKLSCYVINIDLFVWCLFIFLISLSIEFMILKTLTVSLYTLIVMVEIKVLSQKKDIL